MSIVKINATPEKILIAFNQINRTITSKAILSAGKMGNQKSDIPFPVVAGGAEIASHPAIFDAQKVTSRTVALSMAWRRMEHQRFLVLLATH